MGTESGWDKRTNKDSPYLFQQSYGGKTHTNSLSWVEGDSMNKSRWFTITHLSKGIILRRDTLQVWLDNIFNGSDEAKSRVVLFICE